MLMTAFMIRLLEFRSEGAAAEPADRRRMIGGLIRPGKKRVVSLQQVTKKVALVAVAASAALVAAACSSGTSGGGGGGGGGGTHAPVPQISASDFDNTFSAMAKLKPLAKAGRGNVAVILP